MLIIAFNGLKTFVQTLSKLSLLVAHYSSVISLQAHIRTVFSFCTEACLVDETFCSKMDNIRNTLE